MRRALPIAVLAAILIAVPASSTSLRDRTYTMSLGINGQPSDGASSRPGLSVDGGLIAFDSSATNLTLDTNGAVRDVFARDVVGGANRLVSVAAGGGGADGPSGNPAVGGRVIAFHSEATNLVEGDSNGVRDVFARAGDGPVVRVSEPAGGGNADGPSTEPDISEDGRFVAFSSAASNLVPGDSNGAADVFVRDLQTGALKRLSEYRGATVDGPSRAPAISPDGRYVSFYSEATNLVDGDGNGVGDVFVADRITGEVERVSVSDGGREQDAAVVAPFVQISDISVGGRFVAFDSDATNLVDRDRNEDTDVFVRDRIAGRTERVSVNRFGREGDNDSYFPALSADGRFVVFQSFAENLAPGDGRREDVFLVDRERGLPAVMTVGSRGARRQPEQVGQLLRRPAVAAGGDVVAFSSTAPNLAPHDGRGVEDVFLRVASPPRIRSIRRPGSVTSSRRPRLRLRVDDRRATAPHCTLDGRPIRCRDGRRLPRLGRGRHVLRVWAGGPGMRYAEASRTRTFRVR